MHLMYAVHYWPIIDYVNDKQQVETNELESVTEITFCALASNYIWGRYYKTFYGCNLRIIVLS
jgi:hypothetical protein